jgi:hypothetical protein
MALKGLGMGEEKHSKGKLRAPVMMAVIAVMISLFPLLVACSSEGTSLTGADDPTRASGAERRAEGKPATPEPKMPAAAIKALGAPKHRRPSFPSPT